MVVAVRSRRQARNASKDLSMHARSRPSSLLHLRRRPAREGIARPFLAAASAGRIDNLRHLLQAFRQSDDEVDTSILNRALHLSLRCSQATATRMLVEAGACPSTSTCKDGTLPLHIACEYGSLACVKYLIEECRVATLAYANGRGSPLHFACRQSHPRVVQYLVESCGLDYMCRDGDDHTPFHVAVKYGHYHTVAYLLRCNPVLARLPLKNESPLHLAIKSGSLPIVKLLIEEGRQDVNEKGYDGYTCMHIAAASGFVHIATYLLEKGARCDAAASKGTTPLLYACANNSVDMIDILTSAGASVFERNEEGWTALHYASRQNCVEVVEKLVKEYAMSPDVSDKRGWKPLHIAAGFGSSGVLFYLVEHCGVCIDDACGGHTAASIAVKKGHADTIEVIDLLRDRMLDRAEGRTPPQSAGSDLDYKRGHLIAPAVL